MRFKDKAVEDNDLIVMGDFNTPSLDDKTFKALTQRGLQIPDFAGRPQDRRLTVKGSNLGKDARYDQILHMPTLKERFTNHGGTLDFYGSDAFIKELFPDAGYSRTEFTLPALRPLPDLGADRHRHRRPAADADRAERQELIETPPGPREETTCNCG